MGECPVCGAEIKLNDDTIEGELIVCGDCGAEIEVIQTDPVELSKAPEEEEDWGQ